MATDLDTFLAAYIEAALWSSTDNAIEEGGDSRPDSNGGWPLDDNYGPEDIDAATLAKMRADCATFIELAGKDLDEAYASGVTLHYEGADHPYDVDHAGHDFWLTRNGHGAGFWDRGLGAVGDRLTKHAKSFGSYDLSVEGGKVIGD